MQSPLTQAVMDLGLLPDPNADMEAQKKRRQKEDGTAADEDPANYGDRAFSEAALELLGGVG